MLVRDLDTVRVRNAIRAEILAILPDMGLNPPPTPPHKLKRPHVSVVQMVRCQMRAPAREVNITALFYSSDDIRYNPVRIESGAEGLPEGPWTKGWCPPNSSV